MSVEVVEGFGCVLAGDLTEDDFAAWVCVDEVGDVVDFVVDDDPEVFLGGVLWRGGLEMGMRCEGSVEAYFGHLLAG